MAKIASQLSDRVIFTTDNPHHEDPLTIIEEMRSGLNFRQLAKSETIVDRKEAIAAGCKRAEIGDIVLVAGKGHECYQEVNGTRFPFDDVGVLNDVIASK